MIQTEGAMKKKFIALYSLIVIFAIPAAASLFLVFFPLSPSAKSKIFESLKIIDLKNLPKGQFQKVSIKDGNYIIFEVPADKMAEFEIDFRKCVQNATPLKGILCCLSPELKIKTEKGKYSAHICYDDNVAIYGNDIFERGFVSRELRKVFYDAGLKYTSEDLKPLKEKDVNEPL